jgi:nitrite reductase/ring-hydroxylating ferredoxin subunit
MSDWQFVAEESALAEEEMIAARLGDRHLIVYRTSKGLFATSRRCTHQGADLMRGYLEGEVIECPVHQGRFNVRTGAALNAPACEPLVTYEVRLNGGKLEVKLKQP